MLAGKHLQEYTILVFRDVDKENDKIIYKCFKNEYVKFPIQTEKINGTRSSLLEEIKSNDLLSEKHKDTCKYLNYVKHSLSLVS